MDEVVNNFLLEGDTFVPEMDLKQPGFTYSGPFTENKESLFKLEIQTLFKKMKLMKLAFSMIWLTANQKI